MLRSAAAFVFVLAASCASTTPFYDDDYVLYDGGRIVAVSDVDAIRGAGEAAEAAGGGVPADVSVTDEGKSKLEAEKELYDHEPRTTGVNVRAMLSRIFTLESVVLELDEAIAEGLDTDGEMKAKREAISAELHSHRMTVGRLYEAARAERLRQILQLPVASGGR